LYSETIHVFVQSASDIYQLPNAVTSGSGHSRRQEDWASCGNQSDTNL